MGCSIAVQHGGLVNFILNSTIILSILACDIIDLEVIPGSSGPSNLWLNLCGFLAEHEDLHLLGNSDFVMEAL